MKLDKRSPLRFLTQVQVPIWLVLILAFGSWAVPTSLVKHFESKEIQESIQRELVGQIVTYAINIDLLAQSMSQFRADLENWDMALSIGAPVELVTFLGEKAVDSQEIMLERDRALRNQEVILVSIASELEQAGYVFVSTLKERSPVMERIDIALSVATYKAVSPSKRTEYAIEHHDMLSPIIVSLKKLEDLTYKLSETVYKVILAE